MRFVSATLRALRLPVLEAFPGLVHGFEQRLGPPGWETREKGRLRVAAALAEQGELLLMKQIHGTTLHAAPWVGTPEGDAASADRPGQILGIETADCLPVLFVDPELRRVAAVHAGWRGTAAGVVRRTLQTLVERGTGPASLVAALGPSIGPCCYEVGDELREAFGPGGEAFFRDGPRGRPHLDVRAANVRQLLEAGLLPGNIHHAQDCTSCQADLYHSYRREGQGAGRMISFVGWER
jgi:hypothetical protein